MKSLLFVALTVAFLGLNAQANENKAEEKPACHKTQEDHAAHKHGPKCGHKAVKHGDHMDYEHDGHKHHAHADHYDECKG